MASKRRIRRRTERHKERACIAKQRFETQREAVAALIAAGRAFGDMTMHVYCCAFCNGGWHYGH